MKSSSHSGSPLAISYLPESSSFKVCKRYLSRTLLFIRQSTEGTSSELSDSSSHSSASISTSPKPITNSNRHLMQHLHGACVLALLFARPCRSGSRQKGAVLKSEEIGANQNKRGIPRNTESKSEKGEIGTNRNKPA